MELTWKNRLYNMAICLIRKKKIKESVSEKKEKIKAEVNISSNVLCVIFNI